MWFKRWFSLILLVSMTFHGVARADAVVVTNLSEVGGYLATVQGAVVGAVGKAQAYISSLIVAAVAKMNLDTNKSIIASAEYNRAISEKISIAEQTLDKTYRFNEKVADIQAKYGDTAKTSTDVNEACKAISISKAMNQASSGKQEYKDYIAYQNAKKMRFNEDKLLTSRETLTVHNDMFCSTEEQKRGLCKVAAPENLQNADLKSTNLFNPNDAVTYGEKEEIAARSFIDSVILSQSPSALPEKAEKTPAGKTYIASRMIDQRKREIAAEPLREILASRKAVPGLGTVLGLKIPDISEAGLMKSYATKFLDRDWMMNFLPSLSPDRLMEEQVRLMAFSVWMDYQNYQKMESLAALASVQAIEKVNDTANNLETMRMRALQMAR